MAGAAVLMLALVGLRCSAVAQEACRGLNPGPFFMFPKYELP